MESWALDACSLDRILLITEHLLGAHLQGIAPSLPDLSFLTALRTSELLSSGTADPCESRS